MRPQTKNIILFVVLMVLCSVIVFGLQAWFKPPPPPPPPGPAAANAAVGNLGQLAFQAEGKPPPPPEPAAGNAAVGSLGQTALQTTGKPPEAKPSEKAAAASGRALGPAPMPRQEALSTLGATTAGLLGSAPGGPLVAASALTPGRQGFVELGKNDPASPFHLYVQFDPRGAAVRRVVLNKFRQADASGRPANLPDGSPMREELVPDDPDNFSNLLLAYAINDSSLDARPLDTLGRVEWLEDGPTSETKDGRVTQTVTFTSPRLRELGGLQVKKIFSLTEGDYHIGLEVRVERVDGGAEPITFRYQLTGVHGLPVEGRWYTGVFRNALVGQVEKNKADYGSRGVDRNYQMLAQIANSEGGEPVSVRPDYLIRYAGVAIQYFASVIVVSDKQEDGQNQDFLAGAQPTLETAVVKGVVTALSPEGFVLRRADGTDQPFLILEADRGAEAAMLRDDEARFKADGRIRFDDLQPGQRLAVVYSSDSAPAKDAGCPSIARQLRNDAMTQPLWEDDITVRVSTREAPVTKDKPLVHRYLLYNGPVKVMLLDQPETRAEAVTPGLVNHYIYDLNLNSMTDSPSASWIGAVTGPTGISWLLIQITNVMHSVLWFLHAYLFVPYVLCIICLTVMVRGVMFPVSRKQAMTSLRMQQLAPEMKKLQEKHKDDKQALAAAQMEMYRKHGVNPFGTCWLLLLQMPIFMGLYYSLQESLHFRLAAVTPWWIPNLAAPDMLLWWSSYIPFISEPAWYGYLWYLGPYLNILPIVAVSLMLVQQKWTMPPPTDDQQAQQQKIMKYMMVFMGLMFYKVASGLCIYFIASSIWGFAERQFLPKKKPAMAGGSPPPEDKPEGGVLARLLGPKPGNGSGVTTGPSRKSDGGRGKRGKRRQENKAPAKRDGEGSLFQRLRDWWADIVEQARKK